MADLVRLRPLGPDDEEQGERELTPHLLAVGGNIGYAVRPGFRRRGYASAILRQTLPLAWDLGLDRVLVTCDDDNIGSASVIEGCGGVFDNVAPDEPNKPKRRYWILRGA